MTLDLEMVCNELKIVGSRTAVGFEDKIASAYFRMYVSDADASDFALGQRFNIELTPARATRADLISNAMEAHGPKL